MSARNPWKAPASRRGMTLLEVLIATALISIVIAAATALLMAGGRVVHNTEHASDSHDAARLAGETIVLRAREAGAGAPGGLWVLQGGVPVLTNAVFGRDGTTGAGTTGNVPTADGSDDLWLVLPDPNYMGEPCTLTADGQPSGAAVPLSMERAGPGSLRVDCIASLKAGSLHVASDMTSGALLSGVGLQPETAVEPGHVTFDGQDLANFTNSPQKGGFKKGDWVYPVRLVHYYLAPNPATGRSALYREEGRLGSDGLGRPYTGSGDPVVVQDYVEDFQVVFGFDNNNSADPAQYTWQHGLGPTFSPNLRSVRISVVGTGRTPRRDGQSVAVLADDKPLSVENNVRAANIAADGFYRSLFTRRVELPNLATASL